MRKIIVQTLGQNNWLVTRYRRNYFFWWTIEVQCIATLPYTQEMVDWQKRFGIPSDRVLFDKQYFISDEYWLTHNIVR
jgi:hypothetical protein